MTLPTDAVGSRAPGVLRGPVWTRRAGRSYRGSRRVALFVGGAITFGVLLIALFAPLTAPYSPITEHLNLALQGPSLAHPLGVDVDGRDVLSRMIWGARSAYEGIGITLLVAGGVGTVWGLLAGFGGVVVDEILMRTADAVLSFPGIVLAVAVTGVLGPGLFDAMLSVGIVFSPMIARLLRSCVLPLRSAEFVLIASKLGVSRWRNVQRHVLPNAMAPVLVQLCSIASVALIIEAALGFLGLGVQPPAPSWGTDLAQAYNNFTQDPLLSVVPGLAITITALAISQFGDGLRRALELGQQ